MGLFKMTISLKLFLSRKHLFKNFAGESKEALCCIILQLTDTYERPLSTKLRLSQTVYSERKGLGVAVVAFAQSTHATL
jgi:hypothetical protein